MYECIFKGNGGEKDGVGCGCIEISFEADVSFLFVALKFAEPRKFEPRYFAMKKKREKLFVSWKS